jgi:hypothetical protein
MRAEVERPPLGGTQAIYLTRCRRLEAGNPNMFVPDFDICKYIDKCITIISTISSGSLHMRGIL